MAAAGPAGPSGGGYLADSSMVPPPPPPPVPTRSTLSTSSRDPGTYTSEVRLVGRVAVACGDRGGASGVDDGLNPDELWHLEHAETLKSLDFAGKFCEPVSSGADGVMLCKMACGREVQPGLTRTMKRFDTCCKRCVQTLGLGGHDENCGKMRHAGMSGATASSSSRAGAQRRVEIESLLREQDKFRRLVEGILAGLPEGNADIFKKGLDALTAAISGKDDVGKLSTAQVSQGVHEFLSRFDELEAKRCAKDPVLSELMRLFDKKGKGQIKRDQFFDLCRSLLKRVQQEWFPEKLPLSTRAFVQKNAAPLQEVYAVSERLGHGSYGVVHSVEHRLSGERRVCKLIRKGGMTSDFDMILQEIHNMAMLDHPNVVKVYEYFDDDSYVSQIIEPCNGGELKARVEAMHKRGESPYSEAFMRDVMKQTMRALAFMHSMRFAHKDLKPENIMFMEQGSSSVKIIDFGLAELFNPHSEASSMIGGTLLFMPPEVFLTSQMTMKCDIWSAGVVLYNLITGTYPFIGQWPPPAGKDTAYWEEETADRIVNHPMAKHEKLRTVSPACMELLVHILDKDDRRRPDATRCLEREWFKREAAMPTLSVGVVQCVEAYARMSELKKAIFLLMAHQSAVPALNELREIFTHFDVGNRGVLTAQDLSLVLETVGMPPLTIERVVQALDRCDTGTIGWTEFLSAALCVSICRNSKLVDSAFATFDMDRDGKIRVEDLEQVLSGKGGYAGWRARLPEFFLEMVPERYRPQEGQKPRKKLWVSKEQFRDYMGQHIQLRMAGQKLFAVS